MEECCVGEWEEEWIDRWVKEEIIWNRKSLASLSGTSSLKFSIALEFRNKHFSETESSLRRGDREIPNQSCPPTAGQWLVNDQIFHLKKKTISESLLSLEY
jgi:hypothetical protein